MSHTWWSFHINSVSPFCFMLTDYTERNCQEMTFRFISKMTAVTFEQHIISIGKL